MRSRVACVLPLSVFLTTVLPSQDSWQWPDKPQNLRVLPDSFSGRQLSPIMRGFTRALGVRCQYCHIGEEGKPLSTFDFVSDANPNKSRARAMLTMLGDINGHLRRIEKSGDKAVNMWCHTCHRGRPKPMTLDEELAEVYRSEGIRGAIARYGDLKARFLTRGAYDFGEEPLNAFGYSLLSANDHTAAIDVFTLYTTEFPGSANAWGSLAEAYAKSGDTTNAVKYYRQSLDLNPQNENARKAIQNLRVN